jgi:hypothetical protein
MARRVVELTSRETETAIVQRGGRDAHADFVGIRLAAGVLDRLESGKAGTGQYLICLHFIPRSIELRQPSALAGASYISPFWVII